MKNDYIGEINMLENYVLQVIPTKYGSFNVGETIRFFPYLINSSHQVTDGEVRYKITENMHKTISTGVLDLAKMCPAVEVIPGAPGSIQCEFVYEKNGEEVKTQCGVMVAPHCITPVTQMPDDFDDFWEYWKKELAEVPINAKLKKISDEEIDIYDVELDCVGDKPVKALLGFPKNRQGKKYPVSVAFQGAGVRSARVEDIIPMVNRGFIAMEVNAHGLENMRDIEFYAKTGEELGQYPTKGFNSEHREDIYFLHMFLRAKRAIDFMATLNEWDRDKIVVKGSSMGAFQTFAAAYLDKRVSAIGVGVPAGSDILGGGWPLGAGVLNMNDSEKHRLSRTISYFDNVNFARKLKIPAMFLLGLIDPTCVPDGIYAIYNSYGGEKIIIEEPEEAHCMPLRSHLALWDFLAESN